MYSRIIIIFTIILFSYSMLSGQVLSHKLVEKLNSSNSDDYIRAVIRMKERIHISDINILANGKGKVEARSAVVSYIKTYAKESQNNIIEYLNQMKESDEIKYYHSIYSTNKVIINARKSIIENLRSRTDIQSIYYEEPAFVLCSNTWNISKIKADDVWSFLGIEGEGIITGILDSGTDYNHTDLHSNVWINPGEDLDGDGVVGDFGSPGSGGDENGIDDDNNGKIDDLIGWDFCTIDLDQNNDPIANDIDDNDPMDEMGHGTHVSGTVAGDGSAGTNTGIAPASEIICIKVANRLGQALASELEAAIDYAYLNVPTDILNISMGWIYDDQYEPNTIEDPRDDFRSICDLASAAGVIICAAAGNEGFYAHDSDFEYRIPHNITTPGDVPSVITIGATTINDVIATEHNFPNGSSIGPVSWEDAPGYYDYPYPPGLFKPDVTAPGVDITSTWLGSGYGSAGGTSMATPATSGTVALILESNTALTSSQVKDILQNSADKVSGMNGQDRTDEYGYGRINAYEALLYTLENYNNVSGTISSNTTWSGYKYVSDNITVNSGVTLTIEPGTTILFNNGKRITVNGTLTANGTASNSIFFTSINGNPTPGSWYGIKVYGSNASATLNHCEIEYAQRGIWTYYSTNVSITNTTFSNNHRFSRYYIVRISRIGCAGKFNFFIIQPTIGRSFMVGHLF